MTDIKSVSGLFENSTILPNSESKERLQKLVGMDDKINRLKNMISVLINPHGLNQWMGKHHPNAINLIDTVLRRPPLVILAGDVGSGKTELAETIGDAIARQENIDITLLPLSLSSRGQGRVGEMTQLVSSAFEQAFTQASKFKSASGSARGGVILLVDEADALAQSRESEQMHHEDRAGVNAFIRGIDRLANGKLPVAVIMCTNRLNALDPAVRRRAADILQFSRPNESQRMEIFNRNFKDIGFTTTEIKELVYETGVNATRKYGFTYSDLTQRLLPTIILDAYPRSSITGARAIEIAKSLAPTPPFNDK
ncbi:MAG TPA: ATP-binding protein [Methylotenera sp.]|nr:ATP-binding protein [Methylotenera sp.]HPN02103.1 ATP-binding protein [Methylotenera sp.]